jgi:hypothetical protein
MLGLKKETGEEAGANQTLFSKNYLILLFYLFIILIAAIKEFAG